MHTVPNQNIVKIHREAVKDNFIQVSKQNLFDATSAKKEARSLLLLLFVFILPRTGLCLRRKART